MKECLQVEVPEATEMTVHMKTDATGKVTDAAIGPMDSPELATCVENAVRSWRGTPGPALMTATIYPD